MIIRIKNRKSEGLSMNVIVVAAIALIILIVLVVVFSSRMGLFNKGVNSCTDKGGEQRPSNVDCIREGGTPIGPFYDERTGEKVGESVCCIIDDRR